MNNPSTEPATIQAGNFSEAGATELKDRLAALTAWKMQAIIQLERFRTACRIYKFCDEQQVDYLLNH